MNNKKTGAGQYNKLIQIWRITNTEDGQGGGTESSKNVISVYCSKDAMSGDKALTYGQLSAQRVHKFRTRYLRNMEIKNSDFLKYDGREFIIKELIWNSSEVAIIGIEKI